jgi:predicted AlkP superfamily pyrophosphatase or phosphodiesterase
VVGADGKTPTRRRPRPGHRRALAILAKRPEVFAAYDANTLFTAAPPPKGTPPDEISVAERMRRSAYPGRVGDILVAFQPYQTPASPGATYVASHGSPWNYDRRVPILFWWKGGPAARAGAADRDRRHRPDDRGGDRRAGSGRRGRAVPAAGADPT